MGYGHKRQSAAVFYLVRDVNGYRNRHRSHSMANELGKQNVSEDAHRAIEVFTILGFLTFFALCAIAGWRWADRHCDKK